MMEKKTRIIVHRSDGQRFDMECDRFYLFAYTKKGIERMINATIPEKAHMLQLMQSELLNDIKNERAEYCECGSQEAGVKN